MTIIPIRRHLPRARSVAAEARSGSTARRERGTNFHLIGDRALAKSWKERARDNIAAIRLAATHPSRGAAGHRRGAGTADPLSGFGASELANFVFRRPGDQNSEKAGKRLARTCRMRSTTLTTPRSARCTQYAHFTPEFIVRSIWAALRRFGWRGGRVLEPGIGTGLFPALMPEAVSRSSRTSPASSSIRRRRASHASCSRVRGSSPAILRARIAGEVRSRDRQSALLRSHCAVRSRHASHGLAPA